MLGHRLRRWPIIKSTMVQRVVFVSITQSLDITPLWKQDATHRPTWKKLIFLGNDFKIEDENVLATCLASRPRFFLYAAI